MKKILLGVALILAGVSTRAQNGLENIVVEKYYVSNAADAEINVHWIIHGAYIFFRDNFAKCIIDYILRFRSTACRGLERQMIRCRIWKNIKRKCSMKLEVQRRTNHAEVSVAAIAWIAAE